MDGCEDGIIVLCGRIVNWEELVLISTHFMMSYPVYIASKVWHKLEKGVEPHTPIEMVPKEYPFQFCVDQSLQCVC